MEIIKALSWYPYAFIFALICICKFHKEVSDLIKRIKKLGPADITELKPEAQREKPDPEAVQQLLDIVGNSIVITHLESQIKNELTLKGISTDGDSVKVLIRHLAGTQLLLSFEQTHSLIFGSQIYLLKKLNEVTGQGVPITFLTSHFEHIKTLYPSFSDWSQDQYLQFMYSRELLVRHDQQVHITNLGVEYLTWIARNGRSENKPL